MNNSIKKIMVSEKSFQDAAKNKYTFVVSKNVSKEQFSKAAAELFNVTVLKANSMNYKGKTKTTKRIVGKRNNFKKIILSLKPGDKIDLFEIEKDEEKEKKKKPKKIKENRAPTSGESKSRPESVGKVKTEVRTKGK